MAYRFLDDVAISDIAFEAWGETEEELFVSSAEALLAVQIEDVASIERTSGYMVTLHDHDMEMLLFDFLQELIYLKDAKRVLVLPESISITGSAEGFSLVARMLGESIDRQRHQLRIDAKAVTMHRFRVVHETGRWTATVIIDV